MKHLILLIAAIISGSVQLFGQMDLSALYKGVKTSVVTIYVTELVNPGYGNPKTFTSDNSMGSGVLIKENIVLTAAHVVGNASEIKVEFLDGESIPAKTLRIARLADVAVIELDRVPSNPNIARIGQSDAVEVGDPVFVVGAPMGLTHSLSSGIISGRHAEQRITSEGNMLEYFQTDASINTGNSGGPMFNSKGEVIGIVSYILTRSGGFEGIGFAATSKIAETMLSKRSGNYFGTDAIMLTEDLAGVLNVPQESGLLVQTVAEGSPADIAGLQGGFLAITVNDEDIFIGGDIILAVDDIRITGWEAYEKLMSHLDAAEITQRFSITVLRGGEIIELYWISREIE